MILFRSVLLRLFLALLHILPIIRNRDGIDILVGEHKVNAFQFHTHFGIVTKVGMDIAVDVLLLLEDGIVSGNEE